MATTERENGNIVLFITINAPGHMNGAIALADRLKADFNYKCVFAVIGKLMGDRIEKYGHKLIELEPIKENEQNNQDQSEHLKAFVNLLTSDSEQSDLSLLSGIKKVAAFMKDGAVPNTLQNLHQYDRLIKEMKPKIVLMDCWHAPPCLLRADSDIPWVRMQSANPMMLLKPSLASEGIVPCCWFGNQLKTKEERARIREQEPQKWQAMRDEWKTQLESARLLFAQVSKTVCDYYKRMGLDRAVDPNDSLIGFATTYSSHLNIYVHPEAIDYREDDDLFEYPERFLQTNCMIRRTVLPEVAQQQWLAQIEQNSQGKKARILFSLGSIASGNSALVRRYIDMLRQDQQHLYIVSKGINNSDIELDPNNMIGGNYIPQPFLLQHVDMAIVHGGSNGVTECLYHGVPMIALPLFADQPDNAQRIEDKKLGKRLDLHKCTRDQLFNAIEEILSDSEMRARAKLIGEKMRARDDIGVVSNLVNSLAERKSLTDDLLKQHNITR